MRDGLTGLQERETLAQLQNNPAALASAVAAVDRYYKANAGTLFGTDKTALQIALLQNDQLLGNSTRLPGPQLIRPTGAGLGSIGEAGFGSAVAALVGGGANAQARQLALAEETIRRQDQMIAELREMISYLRMAERHANATEKNTRPQPVPTRTRNTHLNHIRGYKK